MQTTAEILDSLSASLGKSRAGLATFLAVSERTLGEWAALAPAALPPKGRRLLRLAEVVDCLSSLIGNLPGASADSETQRAQHLASVLTDGRIALGPVDGPDGDDGTAALISYVCAYPDDAGWRANVKEALLNYEDYRKSRAAPSPPSSP